MNINIINYSFKQKLYDFDLRETKKNFIEIIFNSKKFIIHLSEITSSGKGRTNKSELRRQISPSIKKQLIPYDVDEYKAILLGYHFDTNTFTVWENDISTKTTQSLFTRIETLQSVKEKGFDIHVYKKDKKWSFSFNVFLFPLILDNINLIFTKDGLKKILKKIKSYNKPYDLDDLIMCIDLYSRKGNNLKKSDPELLEISNICRLKAKLINYYPYENFFPGAPQKFRNLNGIYKKLQNLVKRDPNKISKGLSGGASKREKKVWELLSTGNTLDKKYTNVRSNLIKDNIKSENIHRLVETTSFPEINKKINSQIEDDTVLKNSLYDYDFKRLYNKRLIDENNFSDPIKYLNELDRVTELHEDILKKLSIILYKKKLIYKSSKHIDLYSEFQNKGKLFEAKTFDKQNLKRQIRHGIIQLKEYFFFNSNYTKVIKSNTDLFLILNENPLKFLNNKYIDFLKSEKICLCWFEMKTISTLDNAWNREKIFWLL